MSPAPRLAAAPSRALRALAPVAPLALVALAALAAGCASTETPYPAIAEEINATLYDGPVLLAPGDAIDVRFGGMPAAEAGRWDQLGLVVRDDGTASFLSLGELDVGGMTVNELDRRLEQAYGNLLQQSDLTVSVAARPERSVTVAGAVERPGPVPLPEAGVFTLVDALAAAGGHQPTEANLGETSLVRWDRANGRIVRWTFDARTEYWDSTRPIVLQDDDVVVVAYHPVTRVHTWIDRYLRRMIPFPQIFYGL